MTTVTLRNLGGSIVMAVPKKILSLVDLEAGSRVQVSVENGRLIVEPVKKPRYRLAELLARCRRSDLAPQRRDRSWLETGPVGREAL
jgi:antitoxin ChpS